MIRKESIETRVERLHAGGVIDMHFDLPMDLYEKRSKSNVLATEFLPEFEAGGMRLIGAAIYIEDRYLPERGAQVALDQISRLYTEADQSKRCTVCRTHEEISRALDSNKIAFLITMEGVEPIGDDLDLLRAFYEGGVREIGLTHARANAAAHGGIFASTGSSPEGLTPFGRELVRECERLGIIIDLAHINPVGFKEIVDLEDGLPLVLGGVRIEHPRGLAGHSDGDVLAHALTDALLGAAGMEDIGALFPSGDPSLAGVDSVGIGFDFFEFIYRKWPEEKRKWLAEKLTTPHFIPDLTNHSHAKNLTRKLIERGFADDDIEKILRGNWLRIFEELL